LFDLPALHPHLNDLAVCTFPSPLPSSTLAKFFDCTPLHHLMIMASSAAPPNCPVALFERSEQRRLSSSNTPQQIKILKIRTPPPRRTIPAIRKVSQE
jgi:hypothetical protein